VQMLPGQERTMFSEQSGKLAATFGADACRVHKVARKRRGKGTRIRLDFQRRDALAEIVQPIPIPVDEPVDLEAIPVGLTEYGKPWLLALLGTHVLVGGATGSGKASVLWSMMRGIAPAVRDGTVDLWGFDAKNGMELEWGKPMFTRFWGKGTDVPDMATGLSELVEIMEERSDRLAGATRKHEPTVSDPLIVCVIDEAADLTTWPEKKVRDAVNSDISKILRRGRSVGITMALFMQDPRKEAIPFRSLIPNGIGLRMKDIYEIDAILGPGAYKAGADCTDIPGAAGTDQPVDGRGVAYMTRLGETTPLRVRASFVTDEDIGEMALEYPAFQRGDVEDNDEQEVDDGSGDPGSDG
jgi:DNA segregation ATPase FtsK/SpoIIIE, S-DNA-T family